MSEMNSSEQDAYVIDERESDDCSCAKCGGTKLPVTCWSCGGEGYHELYEEDPLWYDEDDIESCDICDGEGGYSVCPTCYPESFND